MRWVLSALTILVSAAAAYAQLMHGHEAVDGFFGRNTAGFGYLASSEAEAVSALSFRCPTLNTQNTDACYANQQPTKANALFDRTDLIGALSWKIFEQRLRDKALEQLLLTHAATLNVGPLKFEIPESCGTHASVVRSASKKKSFSVLSPEKIKALNTTAEYKTLLARFSIADQQMQPESMIQALMFSDRLQNALNAKKCSDADVAPIDFCSSVENLKERVDQSFAFLFASKLKTMTKFRAVIAKFLSETRSQEEGTKKYNDLMMSENQQDLAIAASAIRKRIALLKNVKDDALMAELRAVMAEVKSQTEDRTPFEIAKICALDADGIAKNYPNAFRQAMLDFSKDDSELFKAMLCRRTNVMPKYFSTMSSCFNVKGGPLPGTNPVSVSQIDWDWPTYSRTGYTVTREKADLKSPYKVHLKLYVLPDADLSTAEVTNYLKNLSDTTTNWYNCQSGALGQTQLASACPPDAKNKLTPPVEFKIELLRTQNGDDSPLVHLHRCYRSETSEKDCYRVHWYALKKCRDACASEDVACEQSCVTAFGKEGSPSNNRDDASNITLSTTASTLVHEMGHWLGLRDEYSDPMFFMNAIGEPDSIMRDSNNTNGRLYPRHLKRILQPAIDCAGL